MFKNILDLVGWQGGVNRHGNQSKMGASQIGDGPFFGIFRENGKTVAMFESKGIQTQCDLFYDVAGFLKSVGDPLIVLFFTETDEIAILLNGVREHFRNGFHVVQAQFHNSSRVLEF